MPRAAKVPKQTTKTALAAAVSAVADELLDEGQLFQATDLASVMRVKHQALITQYGREQALRLVASQARSILRKRSDAPLQQELDLGLPEVLVLRLRGDKGRVSFVEGHHASEDDLLAAQAEREHAVKLAEAALANGGKAAERRLDRVREEEVKLRDLLDRLGNSGRQPRLALT